MTAAELKRVGEWAVWVSVCTPPWCGEVSMAMPWLSNRWAMCRAMYWPWPGTAYGSHMRFNWNKPNRKRRSSKWGAFVMKSTVGSCHFPVASCRFPVLSTRIQLLIKSGEPSRNEEAAAAASATELELQRKLVNVRLLSKAEAQLVQFSHSSDVDVDANAAVNADSKSCTGSLPARRRLNNNNKAKKQWKEKKREN